MSFTTFEKSPTATLDYTFDWSQWISGDATISSSSWSADTGLTVASNIYTDTSSTAFISGGEEGKQYFVSNTIELSDGLIETRTFLIRVELR